MRKLINWWKTRTAVSYPDLERKWLDMEQDFTFRPRNRGK